MSEKVDRDLLHQCWVHSHEEDTNTEMVFRPAGYTFPPSRGRKSFELRPDGALVEMGIGPTDRPQEAQGIWKLADDDKIAFYKQAEPIPKRVLQIASVEKDRLVVRKQSR